MNYDYDVFISYKSGKVYGRWVTEMFLDFFKEYLDQSLGRKSNIFVDRSDISDGDAWPAKIRQALARSRCLVAVLSPLYFQSEWCKRECAVMLYREKQLGLRTPLNPHGLLAGIVLHDGDKFPELIRRIQCRQWHDYALVGKGFENTETFIRFQNELKTYAENVASMVERAPPCEDDWLNEQWLDAPYSKFTLSLVGASHTQPVL